MLKLLVYTKKAAKTLHTDYIVNLSGLDFKRVSKVGLDLYAYHKSFPREEIRLTSTDP